MGAPFENLRGRRFGRLLVQDRAERRGRNAYWRCLCDCGAHIETQSTRLLLGHAVSCGCAHRRPINEAAIKRAEERAESRRVALITGERPSPHFFDERLPPAFWDKVSPEPNSGCWLWTGASAESSGGYGRFASKSAHRVSYSALVGPIPDGLVIDHVCRQRCCVNPNHLEPVTSQVNTQRGDLSMARGSVGHWCRRATSCVNGHEFTPENIKPRPNGQRACRTCALARQTVFNAKRKTKTRAA